MKKRKVKCPHCRETITLDLDAGPRHKCKQCRAEIIVDRRRSSRRSSSSQSSGTQGVAGNQPPRNPDSKTSKDPEGTKREPEDIAIEEPDIADSELENDATDTDGAKIRVVQSTQMAAKGGSLYTVKEVVDVADDRKIRALRRRKNRFKQLRIAALVILTVIFVFGGAAVLKKLAQRPVTNVPVVKPATSTNR